jgi:hypothetical protein
MAVAFCSSSSSSTAAAFAPSATFVGISRSESVRVAISTSISSPVSSLEDVSNFPELGADGIYHIQNAAQHK